MVDNETLEKQLKKMVKKAEKLVNRRGEALNWLTEIESVLDELFILNFVKKELRKQFFDILLWEDFRFSTKIKLFAEIKLLNGFEKEQKSLVKKLEQLSSIRNKFAHTFAISTFVHEEIAPLCMELKTPDYIKEQVSMKYPTFTEEKLKYFLTTMLIHFNLNQSVDTIIRVSPLEGMLP